MATATLANLRVACLKAGIGKSKIRKSLLENFLLQSLNTPDQISLGMGFCIELDGDLHSVVAAEAAIAVAAGSVRAHSQ